MAATVGAPSRPASSLSLLPTRSSAELRRTSIDRDEHGLTGSVRGADIYALEDEDLAARYRFVAYVCGHR